MTAGELAAAWAHVDGKEAVYLQVDKETYYNMWPIWGEEMGHITNVLGAHEGPDFYWRVHFNKG
jgi:hypothetical protein